MQAPFLANSFRNSSGDVRRGRDRCASVVRRPLCQTLAARNVGIVGAMCGQPVSPRHYRVTLCTVRNLAEPIAGEADRSRDACES